MNKVFSLVALICLAFMQVMPISSVSARPANTQALACGTSNNTLLMCIPDGSIAAMPPNGIEVIPAGGGTPSIENPNDSGGLQAHVGDTVQVPFEYADVAASKCNIPKFSPYLTLNPQAANTRNISTPTSIIWGSSSGLTYGSGALGPIGDPGTAYGYFQFVVQASDGLLDSSLGMALINFQLNTGAYSCGVNPPYGNDNKNLTGIPIVGSDTPGVSTRRVQVIGALFTLTEAPTPLPNHVSQGNSAAIPVTIMNIGSNASFTLSTTVAQAPTTNNPPSVNVVYSNNLSGTFSLNGGSSVSGTVTVGPFPANYGPGTTITISATGNAGGNTNTQQLVVNLPVLSPSIGLTITSVSNDTGGPTIYKVGDVATYTVTLTNTSNSVTVNTQVIGWTISSCTAVDTLGGLLSFTGGSAFPLAPGKSATATFTHTILSADANPLTDTTNTQCTGTAPSPDTGTTQVYGTNTYSIQIQGASLNVSWAPVTPPAINPAPGYAKPGTAITGTLTVTNSGTQNITVSGTTGVQLVDPTNGTVYATAQLTNMPATILAGSTVTPAPTFSITPPNLPSSLTSVNLVVTVDGVSSGNITIHRQLTVPLAVVFSNLWVIVKSDAPSNVVVLGQTVTYTYTLRNISSAPITGSTIHITSDTLGLLSTSTVIPNLAAAGSAGDTYVIPGTYTYTVTGATPNPLVEKVVVTFGSSTSTGELDLTFSNSQLYVGNTPQCVVGLTGSQSCTAQIVNSQIQAPSIVWYHVLIQNVGPTTVQNVKACVGNVDYTSCTSSNASAWITLTPLTPTLYSLGSPATGDYWISVPANAGTPLTELVTVFGTDQSGAIVTFRGVATLAVVSQNAYWTITKTAAQTTAYVGDTITYNAKACYTPQANAPLPVPNPITGVTASDSLAGNLQLTFPGTAGQLFKGQCATATYTYVPDDKTLLDKPGPIQLVNTVTFTNGAAQYNAVASAIVQLNNPIQVTKTISPGGTVFSGDSLTYTFTIKNLSSHTISGLSAIDNVLGALTVPGTLGAGSTATVQKTQNAPSINGNNTVVEQDTVLVKGTVVNGTVQTADQASATASVTVSPALIVSKTVNNPAPFFYDPSVTYTIHITNVSTKIISLKTASDTMGALASPQVSNTVLITIGASQVPLDTATLNPGQTGTITYTAVPSAILKALGNTVTNTFTVTGLPQGSTTPLTAQGQATIVIFNPVAWNVCTQYAYYGWLETSHWTIKAVNVSTASNPVSVTNLTVGTPDLGISSIPLSTTQLLTPGSLATGNFNYDIPWNSPLKTFDNVRFTFSYNFTNKGNSYAVSDTIVASAYGCKGVTVGPPLIITKTPNKTSSTGVGDVITYTVTISNPMLDPNDAVKGITAQDVTFPTPIVFNPTPLTLNPGGSMTSIQPITHTVTATDPSPLVNTITATCTTVGTKACNNNPKMSGQASVLLPTPLLKLVLNTPSGSSYTVGQTICYTITATNTSTTTDIQITTATANPDGTGAASISTGLSNWLKAASSNNGVITHGQTVLIADPASSCLYQIPVTASTPIGSFADTATLNYTFNGSPGTASASTTVDIKSQFLQVTITSNPPVVVNYGQSVSYKETISNPGTVSNPPTLTNLTVTDSAQSGDSIGDWFNGSTNIDLGSTVAPTTLAPGTSIYRYVVHTVATTDFNPLTFTVTANAKYTVNGTTVPLSATEINTLTISSSQLLLYANPQKTTVQPGDTDGITLTMTNIGPTPITLLNLSVSLNDPTNTTAQLTITPGIPGTSIPGNQLPQFAAASSNYLLTIPKPLPSGYPNPLKVTFTASGCTGGSACSAPTDPGTAFNPVTLVLLIHILSNGNIQITEVPQVSAAPLGSTVTYDVTVNNIGSSPVNVCSVTDNNTQAAVSLTFPSSGTTLQPNQTAAGTTKAPITLVNGQVQNPFIHTTTVVGDVSTCPSSGTTGTVTDTSSSQVTVLNAVLSLTYTTPNPQVPAGQPVTFNLTVTNVSPNTITNIVATDADQNVPITLSATTLAPNASATGTNIVPGNLIMGSSFTSHVTATGKDPSNNTVTASQSATVTVVGAQIAFATPPVASPTVAAAGQTVTFSFTLKNTGIYALTPVTTICVGNTHCAAMTPALASLAVGATSPTESVTYTVQPTDSGGVTLTFQAKGTGNPPSGAVTATANATGQFTAAVAGLALTKVANPTSGAPGATINYTVTLNNTNTTPITVSSLVDTLAGNITNKLSPTTIPANTTKTVTYPIVIPIAAPPTLTNTVTATFTVGSATTQYTAMASANVTVVPPGSGALRVTVTPSATAAAVTSQVTYTIAITNTGTTTISGLSATSSVCIMSSVCSTNVGGSINAGQTLTFVSTPYTIPVGATGSVTNVVTVSGLDPSNNPVTATGSCSVAVIGPGGLTVTKTANVNAGAVGTVITYTIQIANYGTAPLTIKSVSDNLLGTLTSLNNVTLQPNTLAAPIVTTRALTATDPPDVRNTVTVMATDPSNASYTATAFADVLVTNSSTGLLIFGTPNQTVATPTTTLTYSVQVINLTSSSTAVTISSLTATYTAPGGSALPITLAQTTLSPGQETFGTFQLPLTSVSPLPNPLILTLNATGTGTNSTQYTATSQTPPVAIATNSLFAALLTADHTNLPPVGSTINYTLTVTNIGAAALTGLSATINTTSSNLNVAGLPTSPYGSLPGTLGGGSSTALTFAYTVQSGDPKTGSALVNATDVTGSGTTVTVTNTIGVQVGPVVTGLTSTCTPSTATPPCIVKPGQTLPLTAQVAYPGSGTLTSITYTLMINGASALISTPSGWPTSLSAGQTVSLPAYNFSVPGALPTTDPVSLALVVNGTVSSTNVSGTSNLITYIVINPSLSLTGGTTTGQPVAPGTSLSFSYTLTNTSTAVAGSVAAPTLYFSSLNGNVPIKLVVGSSSSVSYPSNPPGSLAPGQSVVLTGFTPAYVVQSTDVTPLSFTASAFACPFSSGCTDNSQTVTASNSGTMTTTVTTTPTPTPAGGGSGLSVTKTANVTNVSAGTAVPYTIVVQNNTASVQTGVTLTDTLPSTLTAGTATTDTGAATVSNNVLTVAIGTLAIGQKATITFNTTVASGVTAPANIVNTACATTSTITTSVCGSATLTVGAAASTLPTTGMGGPLDSGLAGGLLWLALMLSSLMVFGLAAGRGSKGGSNNQTLLIVIGAIVGLVALVLIFSIASSLINKAHTAPAATQTQVAVNATIVVGFKPTLTPGVPPTETPIPPPTQAPTFTPAPTLPQIPPSATPVPLPFQPVGDRSFYMARLKQPGAIPIVELPLVGGTWDVNNLGHSVGHLQATSWLGTTGNTVLVAHIQLTATDFGPFLYLRQVQVGDIAYVVDYGQVYEYQVTAITTVDPSDVAVTYPTVAPELTLITCTGWDSYRGAFLKRFVVTAKLISPAPTPTTQPQA